MLWKLKNWVSPFLGLHGNSESYERGLLVVQALDYRQSQIGHCFLTKTTQADVFRLADIEVLKPWRSKGAGALLMQRALSFCGQIGAKKLHGYVTASDLSETPNLLKWYCSFGFVLLPPQESDHPDAICRIEKSFETEVFPKTGVDSTL